MVQERDRFADKVATLEIQIVTLTTAEAKASVDKLLFQKDMDAKIEMLRLSYARGKEETTGLLEAHRPLEGPLPWPINGKILEPGQFS